MIDLIKRSNFCLEFFFYILQSTSYNRKSKNLPNFRRLISLPLSEFGQETKIVL